MSFIRIQEQLLRTHGIAVSLDEIAPSPPSASVKNNYKSDFQRLVEEILSEKRANVDEKPYECESGDNGSLSTAAASPVSVAKDLNLDLASASKPSKSKRIVTFSKSVLDSFYEEIIQNAADRATKRDDLRIYTRKFDSIAAPSPPLRDRAAFAEVEKSIQSLAAELQRWRSTSRPVLFCSVLYCPVLFSPFDLHVYFYAMLVMLF
jgi:hypothetical protein